MTRIKNNEFEEEYVTRSKDQWDLDYKIMMKGYEVTKMREEFFELLKENMSFVITKISSQKEGALVEEMGLV
ncbi:MAG: hypothetical protein QXJ24_05700 [Thermoplasmatales archaeon]